MKITKDQITKLNDLISASEQISIISHFRPDGDAMGSSLGFYHFLSCSEKKIRVILPSPYSSSVKFLDPDSSILIYNSSSTNNKDIEEYILNSDLVLCLDFNTISRTEELAPHIIKTKAKKVLIDHHPNPEKEHFDLIFSYPESSSTCELTYMILKELLPLRGNTEAQLSYKIAEAISTGLITDTNNFNNSSTQLTFQVASELIAIGIDLAEIKNKVLSNFSLNRTRLIGDLLLNQLIVLEDIGVAYTILTSEMKEKYDFQIGDSEGYVNIPLTIEGIKVSAFFSDCDDHFRVSLRSNCDISVNEFSRLYCNGAGHERAAGGRLELGYDELKAYFENSIREYLSK